MSASITTAAAGARPAWVPKQFRAKAAKPQNAAKPPKAATRKAK